MITAEEIIKKHSGYYFKARLSETELSSFIDIINAARKEALEEAAEVARMKNDDTGRSDISEVKNELGLYRIDKQSITNLINQIK